MEQPFVLERGSRQKWVLFPPVDPYGDGYVVHLRVEVHDDGLQAETTATIDGYRGAADLAAFVRQLPTIGGAGTAGGCGMPSRMR